MALKDHKELQEFIDLLVKEGFEEGESLIYNLFDGDECPEHSELDWEESEVLFAKLSEEFDYQLMKSKGGGEGEGEYCYGVIRIKDKHYKAEWQYYSYSGCDYDYIEESVREVKPKQKTITFYESV